MTVEADVLLDDWLLASREVRQSGQKYDRWRMSSLGYCYRRQFFERLGVPKLREIDAKTLRTFRHGDLVHDLIKSVYRSAGILIQDEGEIWDDDLQVRGHYDALVGGPVDMEIPDELVARWSPEWTAMVLGFRQQVTDRYGHDLDPVVDEIKSMHSRAISKAHKEGAQFAHKMQVGGYFALSKMHPEQFPVPPVSGRLTYVGKDSFGLLTFDLKADWADEAVARMERLAQFWADQTLPPCECAGWQVGYCAYSEGKDACCSADLMQLAPQPELVGAGADIFARFAGD